MIGVTVRTRSDVAKLLAKVKRAEITNLGHAGAALRLTARRSIRRSKSKAAVGAPPHTRRGQLKRAILYAVDKQRDRVVIGPSAKLVGESGRAHEFGGRFRREQYPKRPFMGPALTKIVPRLPKMWADSVR